MARKDRLRWDARYREAPASSVATGFAPIPPAALPGALALDLACGTGRHFDRLVQAGYRVVGTDVSGEALARAAIDHETRRRNLQLIHADLDDWPFSPQAFDLILQCDYLERRILPHLMAAVKSGGYALVETFMRGETPNREGPSNPDYLLQPGELAVVFDSWEILALGEEHATTSRAHILARRP